MLNERLILETGKALRVLTPTVELASRESSNWLPKRDAYWYLRAVLRLSSYQERTRTAEAGTPLGFEEPSWRKLEKEATWEEEKKAIEEYGEKAKEAAKVAVPRLKKLARKAPPEVKEAIGVILETISRKGLLEEGQAAA